MNNQNDLKGRQPLPITVEEFDRKAEAGEDIDEYFDWENGVAVMPGELSPGQAASFQITANLERDKAIHGDNPKLGGSAFLVTLPLWAIERLERVAAAEGISSEELAQLLLVQHLGRSKVVV